MRFCASARAAVGSERAGKTFHSSLRLEQMWEGIEDYGLLHELGRTKPEEAARLAADAMATPTDFVREPKRFREIRRRLLEALSR
jgi:hypothetical protein